jgi:hypothetical protein
MASRRDAEVRVIISGDASGASRAFRQMASDAQQAGTITKQQAASIGRALDDLDRKASSINLTKLTDAARSQATGRVDQLAGGGAVGGLLGDLGGAEAVLAKVGTKAALAAGGIAAVGTAAVVAGKASIEQFQSVGTSVGKFQQTLGVSTEEASRFWFALSASGVNPEQGLDAINQFSVNLTQNADDMKRFGVEIEKNASGFTDIGGTLLNVIDRYQELAEAGDNAAAAQLLSVSVGEEGMRQLQPLLRVGADEFRRLAGEAENVLNEDDLRTLQEFNSAWGALSGQLRLAGAQIGSELAPALTEIAKIGADLAPTLATIGGLMLDIAGVVFGPVISGLRAVGEAAAWAAEKSDGLATNLGDRIGSGTVGGALGNVHVKMGRIAEDSARASDGLVGYAFAQERVVAATAQYQGAVSKIGGAHLDAQQAAEGLADAERDAGRTIAQAGEQAAQQVASANQRLADAHQDAAEAAADLGKAEQDAARTIADANERAAEMISSAERQVADARESRQEAVEDLARAEEDAAERIAEANERADERIVDAQERVADARERAQRTQRDNARRLADAEQEFLDAQTDALTDENPFDAMRRREEAFRDLGRVREDTAESEQDAAKAVAEAEEDLRDTVVEAEKQRADAAEQAADQIGAARKRVADATRTVHDAEAALSQAFVQAERTRSDAAAAAAERINQARGRVAAANASVQQAEINLSNTMIQAENARAQAAEQAAARVEAARVREAQAVAFLREQEELRNQAIERLILFNSLAGNPLPYGDAAARIAAAKNDTGGRAFGGPVTAGSTYLVGERGPELLHMGAATGYVTSNGSGGGATIILNNYGVVSNEEQLVEMLNRAWKKGYGS